MFTIGIEKVILFAAFIFSIILHEVAHGYAAYRLGDPTAKLSNRITLNPIAHIDLVGSIIVPLLMVLSPLSFVLGWAKPVPFNPYYFRDRKKGIMIVGLAGPMANFCVAAVCATLYRILSPAEDGAIEGFLYSLCSVNVGLGIFNLIPVPPLDGSRVLYGMFRGEWVEKYMRIEPYGIFIVLALLWVLKLGVVMAVVSYLITRLLMGI